MKLRIVAAWPGTQQRCRVMVADLLAPRALADLPPPVSPAAVARAAAKTTPTGTWTPKVQLHGVSAEDIAGALRQLPREPAADRCTKEYQRLLPC